MATVQVARRLVNPGKKKKGKMPAALLAYWAKKKKQSNSGSTSRAKKQVRAAEKKYGYSSEEYNQAERKAFRKKISSNYRKYKRAKANPGEIITVALGANPGTRKRRKTTSKRTKKVINTMARRKRTTKKATTRRRVARRNPARRRRVYTAHRRRNSSTTRRRVYRRRRNSSVKIYNGRRSRRRNPGMLAGKAGMFVGLLGGGAVTKLILDRLPAALTSGMVGYLTTGVVAMLVGKLGGKLTKNASLGNNMAMGGYTLLGLKLLTDMVPSLAAYSPFGLRGMGLIAPSSFYNPQVPMGGSMSRFVTPAAVAAAMPQPRNGMGMISARGARAGRMA